MWRMVCESHRFRGSWVLSLGLLLSIVGIGAARAELLQWSLKPDFATCQKTDDAVWVEYAGGQDCIRFFSGGTIKNAPIALVLLRGDSEGWVKRKPADIPDNTVEAQKGRAERTAQVTGVPVIVLARPGTFGSSGNHLRRRQAAEFMALNSALDAIKQRYGIKQFVLMGHSGGATAAAALLTLGRGDVSCAVLTSGAFGLLERAQMLRAESGLKQRPGRDTTGLPAPYDPMEHISGIARNRRLNIIVIGNPRDRVTPFLLQRRFVELLNGNGYSAQLMIYAAFPPRYHDLRENIGLRQAAACAKQLQL